MRPSSIAFTALASTLTLATGAFPGATPKPRTIAHASLGPAALRFGRSIGSPTEGHLVGGMHLDTTSYLRIVPADLTGDERWGLEPLVSMVQRAARAVHRQYSDAVTSVGDLSKEGGGGIDRDRSHESGRDVDLAFFARNAGGRPLLAPHFVSFKGDGTAPSWPGAYFDDGRNWALLAALLSDPEAHVTHVFVASPIRARLLAYAERIDAPESLRVRAADVMQQPRGTLPHDDHFHVRIACPAHMTDCVENPLAHAKSQPSRRHWTEPTGPRGGAHETVADSPTYGSPATTSHTAPPLASPQRQLDTGSSNSPPVTQGTASPPTEDSNE